MENLSDVGKRNIEFVRNYLDTEGIALLGESVGDIHPRKVVYIPATGKAYVKRIKHLHNDTVMVREDKYRSEITHQPVTGEVELF